MLAGIVFLCGDVALPAFMIDVFRVFLCTHDVADGYRLRHVLWNDLASIHFLCIDLAFSIFCMYIVPRMFPYHVVGVFCNKMVMEMPAVISVLFIIAFRYTWSWLLL